MDDKLLTAQQVADFLGLKLTTVRKMTYQRQLPAVRPTGRRAVRYRLSDLEALVSLRRSPALSDDRGVRR